MRYIIACTVLSFLFYFPYANAAKPFEELGYASPDSSATADGMFIRRGKPGTLLIRVYVLGAVSAQGIHYMPEGINLLDAMLYAGGTSDTTKLNGIIIRRRGQEDAIEVDLEDLLEDGEDFPTLRDGDIVQVPYNWRRDISTLSLVTGFLASMTAFTLSLVAIKRD